MSGYDRFPSVPAPGRTWVDAEAWRELAAASRERGGVVLVDAYPGVALAQVRASLAAALPGVEIEDVEQAARPIAEIDALIAPNLTDDRVFGVLARHPLSAFYDADLLAELRQRLDDRADDAEPVFVLGWGAALLDVPGAVLVLADLARWEIQQRMRAGQPNWRCAERDPDMLRAYKRGFFVEWRTADEHKRALFDRLDYVLDTHGVRPGPNQGDRNGLPDAPPVLISGDTFRAGLAAAAQRPFRVVPFFDPGVWGGQWMKDVCDLDRSVDKYAWCFDCVPEENSLLLDVGGTVVELPALDLVLAHPRELLGERTFARFGAEFPIRFDFLDTMEGGNLSLQVHPLTDYIQRTFGMAYTQDESYYLLDAADDAVVYLGLKTGVDPDAMLTALATAQEGGEPFPATEFVNEFPAKKHDHFLIPAGTVHCSGANSMVLEISATPYIFTFKMWDWERVGLDGRPRPIHLDHAARNIQWSRDTAWAAAHLVGRVEQIASGEGWTEERTGLHEYEFIETRRHWFTGAVGHDTGGTLHVANLVEGSAAVVEGDFEPFTVHYAETFIVPAAVGAYTIRPAVDGERCGTITAHVRGTKEER